MPDFSCKEKVVEALKNYAAKKKKISLLRYELEHPSHVSEEELIESLSLSKSSDGGAGHTGHVSNKTMMIALQFQDEAQRMNSEVVVQVAQELDTLEAELARIDYYIGLLAPEQAVTICAYYFERKSWTELAEETGLSQRALIKRRDDGVHELMVMFEFMGRVKGALPEWEESK